jgi:hypothetical protein
MKNERKFSTALMQQMRRDLRGCTVFKTNDRSTTAVPDIVCAWQGPTCWVENKYLRRGKRLKDIIKHDQMIFCHELATATNGRCWIVVYQEEPKQVTIWQPRNLMALLFPALILGEPKFEPAWIDCLASGPSLHNVIKTVGAIRSEGWRHSLVTMLIRDAV